MVAARILLGLGALAVAVTLSAQVGSLGEYRVKAVFLFNFVQFVEWPATAFANERAPLVICVVGTDPFGATLDETVEGESLEKRKLVVRRVADPSGLDGCHLLFVSRSEQPRLGEVLEAVGNAPVLTVSDIQGFVSEGGTIEFFLERNRVRFEISPSHARLRGLKLSSQLLGLGRIRDSDRRSGGP